MVNMEKSELVQEKVQERSLAVDIRRRWIGIAWRSLRIS